MLNNKGQILVFFVLLIPIFILILILVIDVGNAFSQKKSLDNICNLATSESKNLDNNKLKEFIRLNDNKIDSIIIEDNKITLKKDVNGVLSHIVNIKIFNIEVTCNKERNN